VALAVFAAGEGLLWIGENAGGTDRQRHKILVGNPRYANSAS